LFIEVGNFKLESLCPLHWLSRGCPRFRRNKTGLPSRVGVLY